MTTLKKWSSYLPPSTIKALKRLSADKNVPVCKIVDIAMKKVIPAKYFKDQE